MHTQLLLYPDFPHKVLNIIRAFYEITTELTLGLSVLLYKFVSWIKEDVQFKLQTCQETYLHDDVAFAYEFNITITVL